MWCDFSLCGPSRSSMYLSIGSHNSLIDGNEDAYEIYGPENSLALATPYDQRSVFVALQNAGVDVCFIGKYINEYEKQNAGIAGLGISGYVPPGMTSFAGQADTTSYSAFTMCINGVVVGPFLSDNYEVSASFSGTTMTVTSFHSTANVIRPGSTISGTSIPSGVTVVSQLTGSAGSTGTYQISTALTLSSRTVNGDQSGFQIYGTDFMRDLAVQFILSRAGNPRPYVVFICTDAPHGPSRPADRHARLFNPISMPLTPNFNVSMLQSPVVDGLDTVEEVKPGWVRNSAEVSRRFVEADWRDRQECLLAVDELWKAPDTPYVIPETFLTGARPFGMGLASHPNPTGIGIIDALQQIGHYEVTRLIHSSDNGFSYGAQRIWGKESAYEHGAQVTCAMAGPGIAEGIQCQQLTLNIDIPPTLCEWYGATMAQGPDGRSLVSLLTDPYNFNKDWRTGFLMQCRPAFGPKSLQITSNAIRTQEWMYAEWHSPVADPANSEIYGDEFELYDMVSDPNQLHNRYGCTSPIDYTAVTTQLSTKLAFLMTASGAGMFDTDVYDSVDRTGQKATLLTDIPRDSNNLKGPGVFREITYITPLSN